MIFKKDRLFTERIIDLILCWRRRARHQHLYSRSLIYSALPAIDSCRSLHDVDVFLFCKMKNNHRPTLQSARADVKTTEKQHLFRTKCVSEAEWSSEQEKGWRKKSDSQFRVPFSFVDIFCLNGDIVEKKTTRVTLTDEKMTDSIELPVLNALQIRPSSSHAVNGNRSQSGNNGRKRTRIRPSFSRSPLLNARWSYVRHLAETHSPFYI